MVELPLGLGMALAQNTKAMTYFASLPESGQKAIIEHTHQINSRQEMHQYVASLADNNNIR